MYKAFLCHSSEDSKHVIEVAKYLNRNLESVFYYEAYQKTGPFTTTISEALSNCNLMIIFVGEKFKSWQVDEVNAIDPEKVKVMLVMIGENNQFPETPNQIHLYNNCPKINFDKEKTPPKQVAAEIIKRLGLAWNSIDDLPLNPHLFPSEKDIIRFFKKKEELGQDIFEKENPSEEELKAFERIRKKLLDGCPSEWPTVTHWKSEHPRKNRLDPKNVGNWRPEDSMVMAAALHQYHSVAGDQETGDFFKKMFVLPEAGPREKLFYPRSQNALNVAILVSGGIAPGINAVISGILERHKAYKKAGNYTLRIYGYQNGFYAFDEPEGAINLQKTNIESWQTYEGGSMIGTSRQEDLIDPKKRIHTLHEIDNILRTKRIDILYIIGGDGSMKAAHALWSIAQNNELRKKNDQRLSVVAIPKTMDNDILWMWQSFGFQSAVQEARGYIERLHVEVKSNPRLCVVQLFGSDSGFVVSHAVLASATGHCDAALIPEIEFSMVGLARHVREKISQRQGFIANGLVVMAETAIPIDAINYADDTLEHYVEIGLSEDEKKAIKTFDTMRKDGKYIQGQTDDFLRSAGLKIVSKGLEKLLRDPENVGDGFEPHWDKLRVFTNEPRHLLRTARPTATDFILANRLGTLAVDNAMAGYTDFMISQWVTEFVLVPLKLVVLGRKRVPRHGIFWKSVLAKTGQPASMV